MVVPSTQLEGDTLSALESLMSLAVQLSLLEFATGVPKTFCMQMPPVTVGPLSTADAAWAPKRSPIATRAMARASVRSCCYFLFVGIHSSPFVLPVRGIALFGPAALPVIDYETCLRAFLLP